MLVRHLLLHSLVLPTTACNDAEQNLARTLLRDKSCLSIKDRACLAELASPETIENAGGVSR